MGQRERAAYVDHCATNPDDWARAHGIPGGWDAELVRLYAALTPLDYAMVELSRHEATREADRTRAAALIVEIEERLAAVEAGTIAPLTPADRATLARGEAAMRDRLAAPDTRGERLREAVAVARGTPRLIPAPPRIPGPPKPRRADPNAYQKRKARQAQWGRGPIGPFPNASVLQSERATAMWRARRLAAYIAERPARLAREAAMFADQARRIAAGASPLSAPLYDPETGEEWPPRRGNGRRPR